MNPNKMTLGDLGAARRARAARRAPELAQVIGEIDGDHLPLFFTPGKVFANLPAEFPVRVLAPLKDLNLDIAMLLRQVLDLAKVDAAQDETAARMGVIDLFVNLLVSNPGLPAELLATVEEMAGRLFGADGYEMFRAEAPSPEDIAETVRTVFAWYGPSLGKLLSSSTSSTGGKTSKPTSSGSTTSTPEPASPAQPTLDGSGSEGS